MRYIGVKTKSHINVVSPSSRVLPPPPPAPPARASERRDILRLKRPPPPPPTGLAKRPPPTGHGKRPPPPQRRNNKSQRKDFFDSLFDGIFSPGKAVYPRPPGIGHPNKRRNQNLARKEAAKKDMKMNPLKPKPVSKGKKRPVVPRLPKAPLPLR